MAPNSLEAQGTMSDSKHFVCVNSLHFLNNPLKQVLLLSSLYKGYAQGQQVVK